MNKLKLRKQEKRAIALKEKRNARLYAVYAFICFVCGFYVAKTYNLTIVIAFYSALIIFLSVGIPCALLTIKFKKEIFTKDFRLIRDFLLSIYGFGSIGLALFFLINNNFSENKIYKENFYILNSHEAYKNSTNYVDITIDSIIKEISMPENTISEIDKADYISITYKKGLFGYFVIVDKKLVDKN